MKPTKGKIFIRFTRDQVAESAFMRHGTLKLLVARPENPNDFSVEIGTVYSVNDKQKFLRPGDTVLVNCMVFTDGKDNRVASPSKKVAMLDDGSEIYWCYDGTTDDFSDVYARISNRVAVDFEYLRDAVQNAAKPDISAILEMTRNINVVIGDTEQQEQQEPLIEPFPGYVLVENEEKEEFKLQSLLYLPNKKQGPYMTTVLACGKEDAEDLGIAEGDKVMVMPDLAYTVRTEGREFSFIRKPYILLKENAVKPETGNLVWKDGHAGGDVAWEPAAPGQGRVTMHPFPPDFNVSGPAFDPSDLT